ncbi:preprotein translocase subunit SecE [Candidatus Peribacteria bacterium RIFCSPHIGHO2_02_FULL_53_20]|nr:MAG: preprotein translocase subunit SecE [Candidatus Peribacteria bacterium RIFCSPHIGHO2_02_FULL_53_20]OGJ67016.1 MAG: preprotein translocase subunit SecE [Candidatus Peribacteria bacterium RIFCSPLOWO2_01_FULL_53_10]OGJ72875.1 MAG: preprotein translocase subunit SecE [Candidatus Peribacteria bacterium RIFCSPLOWO2_12_FULL_53_10]
MNAIHRYITEAIEELRHTRWPTRQQAIRLSIIVIAFTAACAAVFGLIDFILAKTLDVMLSLSF